MNTPDPRITYRPVSDRKCLVLVNGRHTWDLLKLGEDRFLLVAGPSAGPVMHGRTLVDSQGEDARLRMKTAIGARALGVAVRGVRW